MGDLNLSPEKNSVLRKQLFSAVIVHGSSHEDQFSLESCKVLNFGPKVNRIRHLHSIKYFVSFHRYFFAVRFNKQINHPNIMKAIDTSWRKQHKNLNTKLPSHFNTEYIFYRKGNILFQSTRNMKLLHYSFILIDER